jgi:hypothetical protein
LAIQGMIAGNGTGIIGSDRALSQPEINSIASAQGYFFLAFFFFLPLFFIFLTK